MKSISISPPSLDRRHFLAVSAAAPITALLAPPGRASDTSLQEKDFLYEVTRTEQEWRARLSEAEYFVLRDGGTEVPHSNLNAFRTTEGHYSCLGCDLVNFDSRWKVPQYEIGWTFFSQARPTTILTSIDQKFSNSGMVEADSKAVIECHCRRCASHLGHILSVKGKTLHCLNGSSLNFHEA